MTPWKSLRRFGPWRSGMVKHHILLRYGNHSRMPLHLCARIAGKMITSMPKTSPENLLGAVFSAEMAMMSGLHGLSNITSQAVLNSQTERLTVWSSSAARPAEVVLNGLLVVLNGLLADREQQLVRTLGVVGWNVLIIGLRR